MLLGSARALDVGLVTLHQAVDRLDFLLTAGEPRVECLATMAAQQEKYHRRPDEQRQDGGECDVNAAERHVPRLPWSETPGWRGPPASASFSLPFSVGADMPGIPSPPARMMPLSLCSTWL